MLQTSIFFSFLSTIWGWSSMSCFSLWIDFLHSPTYTLTALTFSIVSNYLYFSLLSLFPSVHFQNHSYSFCFCFLSPHLSPSVSYLPPRKGVETLYNTHFLNYCNTLLATFFISKMLLFFYVIKFM